MSVVETPSAQPTLEHIHDEADMDDVEDAEEWRIIGGFDDYSVSNLGRVRNDRTGWVLKAQLDKATQYLFVSLCRRPKKIHQLVATAFLGDSGGLEVNHIDRDRRNNSIRNLEYCTHSANCRNMTAYMGHRAEYLDELPNGAEPIIEVRGRAVADGFFRNGFEFYAKVGRQYRRLIHSRNGRKGLMVRVRSPNNEEIAISWTP
jgi:hypothetical protein